MAEQFFFDTEKIFENLNPEQREAVEYLNGALLIMAGAGSGKTRVITCRIANLIAQGISPFKILAITFTNKAANEMKTRAEKLIGESARNIVLSTFHSFCARLLRREIKVTNRFTNDFSIFDGSDSKSLIKKCIADLDLDEEIFANASFKISDLKDNLITPAQCREEAVKSGNLHDVNFAMIYELYQKKLEKNNALDFDDLICETVRIFKDYPEILDKYQERFKYILIDEYQDTNYSQYVLANLLAAKYRNLCVVGDADQSIYGWRGADMRNILNFERDYPEAKVVLLEQNYRSTGTILRAANSVIENNVERKPKNLRTENEQGEKIRFLTAENDIVEAFEVAKEIKRLVTQENFLYKEIALLYRMNSQSRLFEERFMREEIPYFMVSGLKFYDRKEIKDALAYLYVIANPRDDFHLMRIINTPKRGIGLTNLNRLAAFADDAGISILEVVADKELLQQVPGLNPKFRASIEEFAAMMVSFSESAKILSIEQLIITVLNESGYMKMIREDAAENKQSDNSREGNLGSLIDNAKEFAENNPDGTLQDFLNHVALISDIDTLTDEKSGVRMMTVHTAKGLEFAVVFIVGMEEGIFPHATSFVNEAELEEERRTCYVAITRAQKKLYIMAAKSRMIFGKRKKKYPSRFIEEISASCLERVESKPPLTAPKKSASTSTYKSPTASSTYKSPTAYRAAAQVKPAETKSAMPESFRVGDRVNHKKWGSGTVMAVAESKITVAFSNPEYGVKILGLGKAPISKV